MSRWTMLRWWANSRAEQTCSISRSVRGVGKDCPASSSACRLRPFQFHGDVKQAFLFASVVDRNDVRVSQQAGSARFSLKARNQLGACYPGALFAQAQGLYRHGAADHRILRPVHHTHGTTPEFFEQLVATSFGEYRHVHPSAHTAAHESE